jgi:3',5'-cyclic AMP phosphodiesterase CpdA
MSPTRIVVVSDSHLAPDASEAEANWSAVVTHVAETAPDLVLHLGDLSRDGAHDQQDLSYARDQLDRLPVPWLVVPGNHDIGDNPLPQMPAEMAISVSRRQRWIEQIGIDWWSVDVADWRLIAIDAQLFGSGLPAEAEQWDWLGAELQQHDAGQMTALITHKPLIASDEEMAAAPFYRFVPPEARRSMADLLRQIDCALVLSGHVHQYRYLDVDGTPHVWAPTTWAVLPDASQPRLGHKRCGVLSAEFAGSKVSYGLVEPDGIHQLTIGEDTPNPYSH